MQILALDLGKFKSVSCCFDAERQTTEYWTLSTDRQYLTKVLRNYQPQLIGPPSRLARRDGALEVSLATESK